MTLDAFLLTAEWRDTPRGLELTLWATSAEGPVCATLTQQEAVMFVPRTVPTKTGRRVPKELETREGAAVDAVYFTTQRAMLSEAHQVRAAGGMTLEADLKPTNRFLMERFINGAVAFTGAARTEAGVTLMLNPKVAPSDFTPRLRTLSLDIETDGWDGPVLSVALAGEGFERVWVSDEREVIESAFAAIREFDPDALLGWNVVDFDLRVLELRASALGIPFSVGRRGGPARVLLGETPSSVSIARVPGRVVLDGVATLRNASWAFERYSLEHVAQKLLGRGKQREMHLDALAEIRRMYREDRSALAAYNLEDARLAKDIFEKAELIDFVIARAKLTGLLLDRQGGSVAAFDHLYLPRLHRRGFVAGDVGDRPPIASPGGHVLDSVPGLSTNVASFDFRSLYPSIIRTFQVDPLALWRPGEDAVQGYDGARFARTGALLPVLITHLHEERNRARASNNETLSRAIKILMNSFYGVLGTAGCRFFDPKLASSITRRGHDIIERSRAFFETKGLKVLYGDTDSLFVHLDPSLDEAAAVATSRQLADEVNAFWKRTIADEHRLSSHLELRFDALFLQFLMPTMRGSSVGSKKRYAGLTRAPDGNTQLVIRGLEAVRTDWTPLARAAQTELLERVFKNQPWEPWLLELRARVLSGALDDQLVYRKRLRRGVDDYANVPPHVKAARLQQAESDEADDTQLSEVEYLMTFKGPEPLSHHGPIDYAHYLERQLAPAVDVVLGALGTSYERVAGSQLDLFDRRR